METVEVHLDKMRDTEAPSPVHSHFSFGPKRIE